MPGHPLPFRHIFPQLVTNQWIIWRHHAGGSKYGCILQLVVSLVRLSDSAPNPDAAVEAGRGLDGEQVSREDNAQWGGEYQSVVAARAPCSGRQSCWTLENMLFARKVANLSMK